MKRFFLVFLALICINEAFGQKEVIRSLLAVAEVSFPDTPKIYHSDSSQSSITYFSDMKGKTYFAHYSLLHSNLRGFFYKDMRDSVYAALIRFTDTTCRLFYNKKIIEYGLHGEYFAFTKRYDSIVSYRYYRCFYFNHSLLSTAIWSPDSLRVNDKIITDYFNTLKFKIDRSRMDQETIADTLFTFKTLAWSVLALLTGVLIIFAIKKFM